MTTTIPTAITLHLPPQDFITLRTLVGARISDLRAVVEPRPASPDHTWHSNARYLAELIALYEYMYQQDV